MTALVPVAASGELAAARAEFARRADRQTVHDWLAFLAIGARNAPASDKAFAMHVTAIMLACRDLPALVWGEEALAEACRTFEFWPAPSVLFQHLRHYATPLAGKIDRMEHPVSVAREAFGYLDSVLASGSACVPPEHAPHPSMPKHEPAGELVRIDPAEVARQLAALAAMDVVVPPESKPEPARPMIVTVNRKPIAKPEPTPLAPSRPRPRSRGARS